MSVSTNIKKLFVLDTNVLISDPASIFTFQDNDIFIPMVVLEELDRNKKGLSDKATNARQASRFLDELVADKTSDDIFNGINLSERDMPGNLSCGRIFFEQDYIPKDGVIGDNAILTFTKELGKLNEFADRDVILVSKDINMRIKAAAIGVKVENYCNEKTIDDVDLLYTGALRLETTFWDSVEVEVKESNGAGAVYRIKGAVVNDFYVNQFIYIEGDVEFDGIVLFAENGVAIVRTLTNYTNHNNVFGINAKNREQNFLLNVLLDPEIDFITVLGKAGSGKSLLTIAAGLAQTMESNDYNKVIITRETVPIGNDIGYLPGTEDEKLLPWMGSLTDNLEVLGAKGRHDEEEQASAKAILMNRVQVKSLSFMRGRSFMNKFLIIDEAQNLSIKQIKSLITRAGEGTKVICLGNLSQIDTPYLTATTSGLTYAVEKFKNYEHGAHITLLGCERSRLAEYATIVL